MNFEVVLKNMAIPLHDLHMMPIPQWIYQMLLFYSKEGFPNVIQLEGFVGT